MLRIAYSFADAALRERALTHRSAAAGNNERLEFFGDALVNVIVAEMLFDEFPKADEGELTRLRARLVSEPALAALARELDIGDALHLGPGELKSGGFRRDSILADAFEALVAAVYLDGGWAQCREVVRALVAPRVAAAVAMDDKDAKTRLQEWLQSRGEALPGYDLVATSGAEHARVFDVECRIESRGLSAAGRGSSRRAAEQAAATAVLALLNTRAE
ncbi:MAG: ribonuclease III [Proteobacteria bacterium]|nr:ribonuclease III [Pseudomonadota bacterium]